MKINVVEMEGEEEIKFINQQGQCTRLDLQFLQLMICSKKFCRLELQATHARTFDEEWELRPFHRSSLQNRLKKLLLETIAGSISFLGFKM